MIATDGYMDLHSGAPYWLVVGGLGLVVPPLQRDTECDAVIIGGGIVGAVVCDALARNGLRVVLLDKRDIGLGSTVASTAIVQYDTDLPLTELKTVIGEQQAIRAYRLSAAAVLRMLELADELECPGTRRHSLYLCTREGDEPFLQHEARERAAAGIGCRWITAQELFDGWGISARGAILSALAGEIDPYRLCHALLRRAVRTGAHVYDRTRVSKITHTTSGCLVQTDRGSTVRARYVIHATGYESVGELPPGLVKLSSTYTFASEPTLPPDACWSDRATVWEHADPYLYLRWHGNRLLVGGEDVEFADETTRDALLSEKTAALHRRIRDLVPGIDIEPAFAWTGTFASTRDSLGCAGPRSTGDPELFAVGFGGNGTTFAAIAADILLAHIRGKPAPDAPLFAPRTQRPRVE